MIYKKITKTDLQKGDLVKTYNDSWIIDLKDNEKILRSTRTDKKKIREDRKWKNRSNRSKRSGITGISGQMDLRLQWMRS